MLTQWVRDRTLRPAVGSRAGRLRTHPQPSRPFGLHDRGALVPGMRADVNLIDLDRLRLGKMEFLDDLPGGPPG